MNDFGDTRDKDSPDWLKWRAFVYFRVKSAFTNKPLRDGVKMVS